LSFRVVDKNNFFFAFTSDDVNNPSGPKKLTVGYYQSGTRTVLTSGIPLPSLNWTTLRVITRHTGSITMYADNTVVYSTTNSIGEFATGAGLYNNAPGMSLQNRWDDFTVLDAP